MSIIGWAIDSDKLEEKFEVTTPEEFVMKTRFDPDTGKVLPKKQKVITKPSDTHFLFENKKYSDFNDVIEAMAQSLDFDYEWDDNFCIYFGVKIDDGDTYEHIYKLKSKFSSIKKKLVKFGIPFDSRKQPTFQSYSY